MSGDGYSGWQEPPRRRGRRRHQPEPAYDPPLPAPDQDPRGWPGDPDPGYDGPGGYPDAGGYDGAGYAAADGYGNWAPEQDPYRQADPRVAPADPRGEWTDPRNARTDPAASRPDYPAQDWDAGRDGYRDGGYPAPAPPGYFDPPAYRDSGGYAQPPAGGGPAYGGPNGYPADYQGQDGYDNGHSYPGQQGYPGHEPYDSRDAFGEPAGYGGHDGYTEPGGYDRAAYPAEPGYQQGQPGYERGQPGYGQDEGHGDFDGYGRPAGSGPLSGYVTGGGYRPRPDEAGWQDGAAGYPAAGYEAAGFQQEDNGRGGPSGGSRGSVRGMDADDDRHSGFFSGFASNDDDHYGKESRRSRSGGGGGRGGRGRKGGGRGRGRAAGTIAMLVVVAVLAGIGGGLYYAYSWYHGRHASYVGSGFGSVVVTVKTGDSALTIAPELERLHVIESQQPFVVAAANSSNPTGLQPGEFKLREHMGPAQAWALLLDPKSRVNLTVVIPDGYRYSKFLPLLAKKTGIPLSKFQTAIKDKGALGLPSYARGNPEGYLWPATYDVAPGETALQILQAAVHQFTVEATALNLTAGARKTGFTEAHIITEASLLEAEVGPTYYAKVARVIDNRLKANMTLGLNSTVAYIFDKYTYDLTTSELAVNSPYNTMIHQGLPPGPIDSPGAKAIQAVLNPSPPSNNWLYFVTVNKTGLTLFTSSNSQFQAWSIEAKHNGL